MAYLVKIGNTISLFAIRAGTIKTPVLVIDILPSKFPLLWTWSIMKVSQKLLNFCVALSKNCVAQFPAQIIFKSNWLWCDPSIIMIIHPDSLFLSTTLPCQTLSLYLPNILIFLVTYQWLFFLKCEFENGGWWVRILKLATFCSSYNLIWVKWNFH